MKLHRSFISHVTVAICSGTVRSEAAAAVKKIANSYDAELVIASATAKP